MVRRRGPDPEQMLAEDPFLLGPVDTIPTTEHIYEIATIGIVEEQEINWTVYCTCLDTLQPPPTGQPVLNTALSSWVLAYRPSVLDLMTTDYRVNLYRIKNVIGARLVTPEGGNAADARLRLDYGQVHEIPGDPVADVGGKVGPRLASFTGAHVTTKSVLSPRRWVGGLRTPPLITADVDDDLIRAAAITALQTQYSLLLTVQFSHNAQGGFMIPAHFSRQEAKENVDQQPFTWTTAYTIIRVSEVYSHQITRRRKLRPT